MVICDVFASLTALLRPVYICPISIAPSRPTTSSRRSLRSDINTETRTEKNILQSGAKPWNNTYVMYILYTSEYMHAHTKTTSGYDIITIKRETAVNHLKQYFSISFAGAGILNRMKYWTVRLTYFPWGETKLRHKRGAGRPSGRHQLQMNGNVAL